MPAMQILLMGGTRFVGKPLVAKLLEQGHQLSLFTRGKQPVPATVEHFRGDRSQADDLRCLRGRRFDVIIDSSGRTLQDSQAVVEETGAPSHRFVYVSSAGIYADSDRLPLDEDAPLDPASRHVGKADTEAWLRQQGIPFTSFRPTYIIGAGNYNPVESWFFDRILNGQPVPLPADGSTITQLGHVNDLAMAMARCLEVDSSTNRIYNCTDPRGVTLRGLVYAAARACGRDPAQVELRSFDASRLDPKARKAFPLRLSHFLTNVQRLQRELAWTAEHSLEASLRDSYLNDYAKRPQVEVDLSADQALFAG
jgi:nucleoside-diphosphate-sugar epimerase